MAFLQTAVSSQIWIQLLWPRFKTSGCICRSPVASPSPKLRKLQPNALRGSYNEAVHLATSNAVPARDRRVSQSLDFSHVEVRHIYRCMTLGAVWDRRRLPYGLLLELCCTEPDALLTPHCMSGPRPCGSCFTLLGNIPTQYESQACKVRGSVTLLTYSNVS